MAELRRGPQERAGVLGVPGRISDHDPSAQARNLVAGQVAARHVTGRDPAERVRGRRAGFQQHPPPSLRDQGSGAEDRGRAEKGDHIARAREPDTAAAQPFRGGQGEPPVIAQRVRRRQDAVLTLVLTASPGRLRGRGEPGRRRWVDKAEASEPAQRRGSLAWGNPRQMPEQLAERSAARGGLRDQHVYDRPVDFRAVHQRLPGRSRTCVTGRRRSGSEAAWARSSLVATQSSNAGVRRTSTLTVHRSGTAE